MSLRRILTPTPKSKNLRVITIDSELEFSIQNTTTGKQLFDQVVKTLGLREIWYFGLQYKDSKILATWLKLDKKVLCQDILKENPIRFHFKAKYFPEDISQEIIQEITLKTFFLQVKNSILREEIYCSPETCVLLASYAVQIKYGDYTSVGGSAFLSNDKLIPKKVMDQFEYSESEWHDRIIHWYQEHVGMLREEAMMEYLKIAQDLEMYGVNYFEIKNKKGTELWLGVDALGLNIYEKEDKMTPKIGFPWSEIRNISFNDKKFVIKPVDKKAPDVIFYSQRLRINKRILSLCMGNHELYMRRRKIDCIEVQQMKAQAREEKLLKERERQILLIERQACEEAIREKNELIKKLNNLEQDANMTKSALEKQTKMTKELEYKSQKAIEERKRLELEILNVQQEHRMALEHARVEKEMILNINNCHIAAVTSNNTNKMKSNTFETQYEGDDEYDDEKKENYVDLQLGDDLLPDEPERNSTVEKNQIIKKRLEELRKQFEQVRDPQKKTKEDTIHQANIKEGRDKYKTLKQVRQGNTKKRVDAYDSM